MAKPGKEKMKAPAPALTKKIKKKLSTRRIDIYRYVDPMHNGATRYVGQAAIFAKRIAKHLQASSKCALLREEYLRRRVTKNPMRLEEFELLPELPEGVPEYRADAFESVGIHEYDTVLTKHNELGLNCRVGNNMATTDMQAVTAEFKAGYKWPELPSSSEETTTLALDAALDAARRKAALHGFVVDMLDDEDLELRKQLVVSEAQRDALERAATADNPFQLARTYKEQYQSMNPGARVTRSTAFAELKAVAQMQPNNDNLQREYRLVWCRLMHPDRSESSTITAHQALIVFMAAEEFCALQMEATLHKEKYVEDYDIYANTGGHDNNHYMNALALRDFLDENERMPRPHATKNKDAGPGAVAEERLGQKMVSWKKLGRKEQATYDVVLRHHGVFFNWKADVQMQARNQSEIILKLFLGGFGFQKCNDDNVDPDAKPMPSKCRACGKQDANYQAVKNYLEGKDTATAIALDKWEQKKPEDAGKVATYRAVHAKNRPTLLEKKKASEAERIARGKALKAAHKPDAEA